jgi:DNA-binding NtrC family response regulator
MTTIKRFLIVDDNADARSLLTRTLLRKFPQCLATECGDATTAILTAREQKIDAIIVHRAGEVTGLELVPQLKKVAPKVPLIYVSGIDRSKEALAAGANAFLNYDAWLGLGTLVSSLLQTEATAGSGTTPPFSQKKSEPA